MVCQKLVKKKQKEICGFKRKVKEGRKVKRKERLRIWKNWRSGKAGKKWKGIGKKLSNERNVKERKTEEEKELQIQIKRKNLKGNKEINRKKRIKFKKEVKKQNLDREKEERWKERKEEIRISNNWRSGKIKKKN